MASTAACCQVITAVPDRALADRLATALVEERLAACVQLAGPIESTYRWQGRIERSAEWHCHCKTTLERAPALQRRLQELHPYEVPEIVVVPLVDGDPSYLRWIEESVRTDASPAGPSLSGAPLPPRG
jgi:periplasmic divalent cation tolerance protein